MNEKISKHPALNFTQEISDICKPLHNLGITYFAHVHIDKEGNFSALNNNPKFIELYMNNKYYNADIHTADNKKFGNYVIWDALELRGKSKKMDCDAGKFGVKHPFTIIERSENSRDFYHFANNYESKAINQVYITNLDLLKKFVLYFKDSISQSKSLSSAYDIKFELDKNVIGYTLENDMNFENLNVNRAAFLQDINQSFHTIDDFPPQQARCLKLLLEGKTAKEIANQLNLSRRSVEHYIQAIRKKLNCKNKIELFNKMKYK